MVVIDENYVDAAIQKAVRATEERLRSEFKDIIDEKVKERLEMEKAVIDGKMDATVKLLGTQLEAKETTINQLMLTIGKLEEGCNSMSKDIHELQDDNKVQDKQMKQEVKDRLCLKNVLMQWILITA